ncbi:hypothetical protein PX699_12790 [Sphingobium sp. H39-3-25]|uniref:hypothetical protein n=1 Tax=Sphingobium arseniciresistens TaxID=3030834 RepID=UPI0023BA30EA|nr:hypothetical protein [Sphingobium arseniciresistens]
MHIRQTPAQRALRERAYHLADSGSFANVHEVERALIGEGWADAGKEMQGDYLRKAVGERCKAASH